MRKTYSCYDEDHINCSGWVVVISMDGQGETHWPCECMCHDYPLEYGVIGK